MMILIVRRPASGIAETGMALRPATPANTRIHRWQVGLVLLLALLALALTLPIPLTAPINEIQLLRIGGAELSLWLLGWNGLAALMAGAVLRRATGRAVWPARLALAAGLIGAGLAAVPGSE